MGLSKKLIILCLLFTVQRGEASNYHEHLQVMASYDDYVTAFKAQGQDLSLRSFDSVVTLPTAFRNAGGVIIDIFGQDVALQLLDRLPEPVDNKKSNVLSDQLHARLTGMSFVEVSSILAKVLQRRHRHVTPARVQRSFFELTAMNLHNRYSYMTIGWTVRRSANEFLYNSRQGIAVLFKSFFERTSLADRRVISLEADVQSFLKEEKASQLKELRRIANDYGTRLEYFAGLRRTFLTTITDADFEKQIHVIKYLTRNGAIDGIDITGSIFEDLPSEMNLTPEQVEKAQGRLIELCEALSHDGVGAAQLRIHSFEASNEGGFYQVIYGALRRYQPNNTSRPSKIRIGHVAHLSEEDIRIFKQIQNQTGLDLFFEVNAYSNEQLQRMGLRKIVATINRLADSNLNFGLGVDGSGIFGHKAQFRAMRETLKQKGLSMKASKLLSH